MQNNERYNYAQFSICTFSHLHTVLSHHWHRPTLTLFIANTILKLKLLFLNLHDFSSQQNCFNCFKQTHIFFRKCTFSSYNRDLMKTSKPWHIFIVCISIIIFVHIKGIRIVIQRKCFIYCISLGVFDFMQHRPLTWSKRRWMKSYTLIELVSPLFWFCPASVHRCVRLQAAAGCLEDENTIGCFMSAAGGCRRRWRCVTDVVLQVPSEALSAPTRSRTYHLWLPKLHHYQVR